MNEEKARQKDQFLRETERQLRMAQVEATLETDDLIHTAWNRKPLCTVDANGTVRFSPDNIRGADEDRQLQTVIQTVAQVKEYLRITERAPALKAVDLDENYKILVEFDDIVLAGRMSKNGARFVTWEYDFDRRGVHAGHYFMQLYESAKQDFAVRAGLVNRQRLFSDEQLAVIQNACEFALEDDATLSYGEEKLLRSVQEQIEQLLPEYKQSLKTYLRFLREEKSIEDEMVNFDVFTRDYIKEFIIWLKNHGASTRTINLRITSIRSFLKYCGQEDFELRGIYESVCQIQKLKEEKHPILYLQPEATAAILSAYDIETQKHRRNRMILILLYDTGARVQELADLDIESLHLEAPNPYISIIGKGRKRRNVPIMKKTVAHLNSYLKEFHPSEQPAPLFYSMRDGKPHRLSTDSISLVVGTAAKTARETCSAVPENVHCHLFRKTKAMDLYKSGVPLPFIMQLLGHESMSTTSGFYAFATLEMMSEAIIKSAPSTNDNEKLWKSKDAKRLLYTLD